MKAAALTLSFVAAIFSASALAAPSVNRLAREFAAHGSRATVLVAAHRADWRAAPENSAAAIRSAADKQIPIVEIDIQRSKDGELVLMHDTNVDRTTNGTGNVADKTLAELRALRLKKGLGGAQAEVTDELIPTLAEALAAADGRTLLQLDKSWAYRDQIYTMLSASNQLDRAIFKSSAPPEEVKAFTARDPRILYMHILEDANAGDFNAFTAETMPKAFEIIFDRLTDAQIQPAYVNQIRQASRVWINTMWKGLAGGYTDEASLIEPKNGWASVVGRHHASAIQTDNPVALMAWLASRRDGTPFKPTGIVIQAEDYVTDGKDVGYHDVDDGNNGGSVYRPYEGVDVCNQEGSIVMCYIRGGEWVKYRFKVAQPGMYQPLARVSSPYRPAGLFSLEFDADGNAASASVLSTTSHTAFEAQPVGTPRYFSAGRHELMFRVDPTAYQNFNVDYFELRPQQ